MAQARMDFRLNQRQEMRLKLSQQVIQSLELLQLPILELTELVTEELLENPTLELKQDVEEPVAEDTETPPEAAKTSEPAEDEKPDQLEDLGDNWNDLQERSYLNREETDRRHEMLQNVADKPDSLQDHLRNQIVSMELPESMRAIAEHVVQNINENGHLQTSVEEMAAALKGQFTDRTEGEMVDDVETIVRIIHKLDPRGVGARDTRECLILQLQDGDPLYVVKCNLIERYMEDIGHNRLPKVADEMNLDLEHLKSILAEISKLNLNPGANFSADRAPTIYPDVTLKEIDEKYEITLEESFLPSITINRKYQEMLKKKDLSQESREFIQKKLESGKRLISAIEQRRVTIFRIVEQLVQHQEEFLEKGIEYLKPLRMQDVADTIGVHVSTVSRAISDKFIQTPRGIFHLKFFFASGVPENGVSLGGEAVDTKTRLALMGKIEEIISGEDKKNPLSDSDVVRVLKDHGLAVARRTVAKYREELHVPSSRLRKQY